MMKKIFVFIVVFGICSFAIFESAQAIRITLKRVVFEGPKRTEVLTIINNTDKAETYRLGWRHYRMTENKSLIAVPDDNLPVDIKPVTDMVVFSPRRITVPPQSSQQVRMMLRLPAGLPDGEYRSHFWVRPEGETSSYKDGVKTDDRGESSPDGSRGKVSIKMLAGVTMPVIVRKGNLEAVVGIEGFSAAAVDDNIDVSYTLTREGGRSVYGDVELICNPDSLDNYVLKLARGIALYTEVNKRNFTFRIEKPFDKKACRNLLLTYSQTDGFEGNRTVVMAEARATVK